MIQIVVAALGLFMAGAASSAGDAPRAPEVLVSAFENICRPAFPDLGEIRRRALAAGWAETGARPIGRPDVQPPQVLRREGMTLFLTMPNAIGMRHACQVAGRVDSTIGIADLAAAMASASGLGAAELSRSGGSDLARWTSGALVVQASVVRGRTRSASLQIRLDR